MFTPDAVWDSGPFEGAFDGPDAIRRHLEAWVAPYEDYEGALEGCRDLGTGVTAVVGLARAPTKGSRQFIEYRYAVVITWADCLIQRGKVYNDPHRARAAAERLAEESRYAVSGGSPRL